MSSEAPFSESSPPSANPAGSPAAGVPPGGSARVRVLVLEVLDAHRTSGRFAEDLLDDHPEYAKLETRDRGLARELALGTVRHRGTLDVLLATFSNRPREGVQGLVWDALRLGAYQLAFLDRIPAFAAVDQTVEAVRRTGAAQATGFVNGVLRALLRDVVSRGTTPGDPRKCVPVGTDRWVVFRRPVLPPTEPAAEHLAAAFSYPVAMVRRWLRAHQRPVAEALFRAGNQSPPVCLRVNPLRTDREALLARLIADGVAARPHRHPAVVVLDRSGRAPATVAAFTEGWATAQDATAVRVGEAVQPPAGGRVLDLCAAPGGKSTHLAELMGGTGLVLACDVSDDKLAAVSDNAARLGLSNLKTVRADRLESHPDVDGGFDCVLVDVPCSNSGVVARRAESRWRFRPEDLETLALQQLALLRTGARHLRPGGRLVYSTCSIEPEENTRVVDAFLDAEPKFRKLDAHLTLPEAGPTSADWSDGGFHARLVRGE